MALDPIVETDSALVLFVDIIDGEAIMEAGGYSMLAAIGMR